jgi:hypothetical protein
MEQIPSHSATSDREPVWLPTRNRQWRTIGSISRDTSQYSNLMPAKRARLYIRLTLSEHHAFERTGGQIYRNDRVARWGVCGDSQSSGGDEMYRDASRSGKVR